MGGERVVRDSCIFFILLGLCIIGLTLLFWRHALGLMRESMFWRIVVLGLLSRLYFDYLVSNERLFTRLFVQHLVSDSAWLL